jgi:hypothetical protein
MIMGSRIHAIDVIPRIAEHEIKPPGYLKQNADAGGGVSSSMCLAKFSNSVRRGALPVI